jgi:hypothetical protein
MNKCSYVFINCESHFKKEYKVCEPIKRISIRIKVVQSFKYLLEIKRGLLV